MEVSWRTEGPPGLQGWKRVHNATFMVRVRQAILRIVAILCAAAVLAGIAGREDFFVGTVWEMARWPVLAVVLVCAALFAGRARIALAAIAALGVLEWGAGEWREARPVEVASRESLRVVSFNLLFRGGDPKTSEKVVLAADADVLALQEVTDAWEERLAEDLRARYPHQVWRPHKGTHGFALLSKHPIAEVTYLDNAEGRAIAQCAEIQGAREVYFCNVHLASPAKALWDRSARAFAANADRRAQEWERLEALIAKNATTPRRIIAGDLNTMPQDPLHRAITSRWVDAWEWANDGFVGATWPHLHGKTPVPLFRIDYVLVQGPLVPEEAAVMPRSGSDHRPLRARVRL